MAAILNTKNKFLLSGLAGVLGALILLTAIGIAAKIAVIVSAAVVAYLLLSTFSLIQKIRTWAKIEVKHKHKTLEDEGYGSEADEEKKAKEDVVVSTAKQKKTQVQLEEEREAYIKQLELRLNGRIDGSYHPIPSQPDNENNDSVNIVFADQDTNRESYIPMVSLPTHMNGLFQEIPTTNTPLQKTMPLEEVSIPNTHINIDSSSIKKKLSPEELLSELKEMYKQKCEHFLSQANMYK